MTGPDEEFKKKLLATFREEAGEYVNTITEGLLELEKTGPVTGAPVTERVFRTIHSLKGAARAVNLKEIELVCQNLENVFAAIKKGAYFPDADAYDIFHSALKVIRAHLQDLPASPSGSAEIIIAIRKLLVPKKSEGQDLKSDIRPPDSNLPPIHPQSSALLHPLDKMQVYAWNVALFQRIFQRKTGPLPQDQFRSSRQKRMRGRIKEPKAVLRSGFLHTNSTALSQVLMIFLQPDSSSPIGWASLRK